MLAWLTIILLGGFGLSLSSLFSGSETGFYQLPRLRLQMDALRHDRIARGLLLLVNAPSLFVATVLVGNNIANNLVSISIVLAVHELFPDNQNMIYEIVAVLLLSPFLFVYGEMFPKFMFLNAPYRFTRRLAPLFLILIPIFLPISLCLWGLNRLTAKISGHHGRRLKTKLGRGEISGVFEIGYENGVLFPVQQKLTQEILRFSSETLFSFLIPVKQIPCLTPEMSFHDFFSLISSYPTSNSDVDFPVWDSKKRQKLLGYVRRSELESLLFLNQISNYQNSGNTILMNKNSAKQCSKGKNSAEQVLQTDSSNFPSEIEKKIVEELMRPISTVSADSALIYRKNWKKDQGLELLIQIFRTESSLVFLEDTQKNPLGFFSASQLAKNLFGTN